MKKIIGLVLFITLTILLSGCGIRERLLAPPDEWEAPDGTLVAVCTVDEDVYKYLYKDDGVYQYYMNDVLQDDIALESIQEQAFLNGGSMDNYLRITYDTGVCVITNYYEDD